MKRGLFTFAKPSENSITVTTRMVDFIGQHLDIEPMWDERIAQKWDILYIVSGAYAFCNALEHIGYAVQHAKRVVWIQNDYTIVPPKPESNAESPFRKAFRLRHAAGLPPIDYWTTVEKNCYATPNSIYVNWNTFAWNPRETPAKISKGNGKILYYGAFRENRAKIFDRYFTMDAPWVISNSSGKFEARYPGIEVVKNIGKESFNDFLHGHSLGLYIEDAKSSKEFHSPATRFYEMLGAGLPMAFQPESVTQLGRAGIDVTPYVVSSAADIHAALKQSAKWRIYQREAWVGDYKGYLIKKIKAARKATEGKIDV